MKKYWVGGVVGLVVVAGVAAIWWFGVRDNPVRAFNDMLSNNLSTPGVTRVVKQGNSQLQVAQYTQLQLGAQPAAHALTVFKQGGGLIATEEISDRTTDLVRYQKIVATTKGKDGKPLDVSSVVGKWAKLSGDDTLSSSVTSGLFDQTLMGVIPIANLQPDARQNLLAYMHSSGVFTYDASKVQTVQSGGRKAYKYAVSIKPAAYIKTMQEFGKLVGVHQYDDVEANDYASVASIPVTIVVDARSHQLAELDQQSSGRNETYQGFGLMTQTALPKATLTAKQLTELLGKLQ